MRTPGGGELQVIRDRIEQGRNAFPFFCSVGDHTRDDETVVDHGSDIAGKNLIEVGNVVRPKHLNVVGFEQPDQAL